MTKNLKKILLTFSCFTTMIKSAPERISPDAKIKIGICKKEISKLEDEIKENEQDFRLNLRDYSNFQYPVSLSFINKNAKIDLDKKNDVLRKKIQDINYQISRMERE